MNIIDPHSYTKESPAERPEPLGRKGNALYLNNTALAYHWGCYGTSMAIYETLIHAGYSITTFDVDTTHEDLGFPPMVATDQAMLEFAEQLKITNNTVFRAMRDADILVVNGEGTLHRFHRAPRGLLSLMKLAKMMGKRVHLLNHACFPSGDENAAAPLIEEFYRECLKNVDRIVVRDEWSAKTYQRLGIACETGFDCLPLYINKYYRPAKRPRSVIIGGASHWTPEMAAHLGHMLKNTIDISQTPVVFLAGGAKREPREDIVHFNALRQAIPDIQLQRPESLQDWLSLIDSAKLMITGRFHHFIAAATLSTPIVALSGNTAKTNAISGMLGAPAPFEPMAPNAAELLRERVAMPFQTSNDQVRHILERAVINFRF